MADYNTAYAAYLEKNGGKILSSDFSIDMKEASEGIRTYSDNVDLDLSACEGLHAYTITNFNTTTGALTLRSVTKLASIGGYLLMGNTGTYTAKVTAGVDWDEENMLAEGYYNEPEETFGGVTYVTFILAGSGEKRGFHPLSTGGYLPENVLQKDRFPKTGHPGNAQITVHLYRRTSMDHDPGSPLPRDMGLLYETGCHHRHRRTDAPGFRLCGI